MLSLHYVKEVVRLRKYEIIYQKFCDEIEQGILKPGDCLPSERLIMEEYDVSRDTVRKAMNYLEQNHYIMKMQGRESVVIDRARYELPISQITTFSELAAMGKYDVVTIVEDLSVVVGNKHIMKTLNVDEEEEVYRLSRIRKIDGERVILDKDLFIRKYVPKLTVSICEGSIYNYLENKLNLKIGIAEKIITVCEATDEDKKLLELNGVDYVAVVKSFTSLETGELFQYTESRYRVDKFQFVEYAKRL